MLYQDNFKNLNLYIIEKWKINALQQNIHSVSVPVPKTA
jgi:hypothetical protein